MISPFQYVFEFSAFSDPYKLKVLFLSLSKPEVGPAIPVASWPPDWLAGWLAELGGLGWLARPLACLVKKLEQIK